MIILVLFAFVAGIITIASPCILPVLPILLSGSVGAGRKRAAGVLIGFVLSFTIFTLFLATIVRTLHLPSDALRTASILLIVGFGLIILVPKLQELFEKSTHKLSQYGFHTNSEGLGSGLIIGMSLGLVWTPCVGPILAAVISLAVSGEVTSATLFITFAYAVGTALPMLLIMRGGRRAMGKIPWLTQRTNTIQRIFGAVMILVGISLWFGLDRRSQNWILTAFPSYSSNITAIETSPAIQQQLEALKKTVDQSAVIDTLLHPQAPDFYGGTHWINSDSLSLKSNLKGKVVLVDFWTYSCINCVRTLPYLESWYQKYKDDGLVIVGVHSPEFEFEKKTANVEQAIRQYGITYPVVQDNNFAIWKAYNNQYWPAHYLIDKNGVIRYTHFGEGAYQETENEIRTLIGEAPLVEKPPSNANNNTQQTPETYLGYDRAEAYQNTNIAQDLNQNYVYTPPLKNNKVGLTGVWEVSSEYILASQDNVELDLRFISPNVYLVMSKANDQSGGSVKVYLDGTYIQTVSVDQPTLYNLVKGTDSTTFHLLQLKADKGILMYAFTFGT